MGDEALAIHTLLFAQHGVTDTHVAMQRFAEGLGLLGARVIAPSLGIVRTWLRFEPLIELGEKRFAGGPRVLQHGGRECIAQ